MVFASFSTIVWLSCRFSGKSQPNLDSSAIRCMAIMLHNPLLDPRNGSMREALFEVCLALADAPAQLRDEYKVCCVEMVFDSPALYFAHSMVSIIILLVSCLKRHASGQLFGIYLQFFTKMP